MKRPWRSKLARGLRKVYYWLTGEPANNPHLIPPAWQPVRQGPLAGLEFFLPGGRDGAWGAGIAAGTYEREMLDTLRDLARQGGVLYDIGAHMGLYTCAWLTLGGTRAETFEPTPISRQVLIETLARNRLADQARVHALALGDFNGPARLVVDATDVGTALAAHVEGAGSVNYGQGRVGYPKGRPIPVPVRRLDDLARELDLPPPAVIKLDVEGAETQVLAGAARLLVAHRPALLCEVHNIAGALALADHLARLGYTMRIVGQNGPLPACLWTPTNAPVVP